MERKFSKTQLAYLYNRVDYNITDVEEKKTTVCHKLPYYTSVFYYNENSYLKGFEEYYEKLKGSYGDYRLKNEYINIENRPVYSIDITYKVYTVVFTSFGKEKIKARYEMHKKQMERYTKMMD